MRLQIDLTCGREISRGVPRLGFTRSSLGLETFAMCYRPSTTATIDQKDFHPYLSPSYFFLLIRQISSQRRLGPCGHRASSVRAPHTTEVHQDTSPRSDFHPESSKLPSSVRSQTQPSHPSTPASRKKQRAFQPTTRTTTIPRSPTSVTPAAMLPSPTTTSRRALYTQS